MPRKGLGLAIAGAVLLWACGDDEAGDDGRDAAEVDGRGGEDAGGETAPDAGPSATMDAGADAGGMLAMDAGPDTGQDADVQVDAGHDAAPDEDAGAEPDASDSSCTDDGLEDNDTQALATRVNLPLDQDAQICALDPDWYSFAVAVGDKLDVVLTFDAAGSDLEALLFDPTGALVETASGSAGVESLSHTVINAGSGDWAVVVQGATLAENAYNLDVQITPPTGCIEDGLEDNDTPGTATPVTPPYNVNAATCAGDDDYYAFDVTADSLVEVALTFSDADLELRLYDETDTEIASSTTSTPDEAINTIALTSGTYKVRVDPFGSAESTYNLDIQVTDNPCVEDGLEDNDTDATATPVTLPYNVDAAACVNDDDYYSFDLDYGDTLQVTLTHVHADGDLILRLYDSDGAQVAARSADEDVEVLTYVADELERHALRVEPWNLMQNSYNLDLQVTPAPACVEDGLEDNDTSATAAPISVPFNMQLASCGGDEDFYAVDLTAGDTINVLLTFTNADGDLDMTLYDDRDFQVAVSRSSTDNELISHFATRTGAYVVQVEPYLIAQNDYTLDVQVTPSPCVDDGLEDNDELATATPVAVPYNGAATVCVADWDYYSFTAGAGDTIDVTASFTHANGDVDIALYNPANVDVASSTSVTDDEAISYVAPVGGTYTVLVYPLIGDYNDYTLDIQVTP